jgi:serine/threonine protein kinase
VKLFEPQFGGGSVLAEVRTLQSVAHVPGAVRLHDWSERRVYAPGSPFDGRYFIAMELLPNIGLDFYRIAPAAPAGLPEPVLRAYARSIAQTLRAAHAAGVAHLDIKLENVCLDASFAPRVVDWGCSVANIDANRTRLSRTPASVSGMGGGRVH